MSKVVVIISGPTASGKTDTSIRVAKELNAEVVNFDSLVFYKELSIGTAKPTKDEMGNIVHHLVGDISIAAPINAAQFQDLAIKKINDIHHRNKAVVLVGGSGFYLQTLLNGMYKGGTTAQSILDRSNELYSAEGIAPFRCILKKSDFESFQRYHENDHYRIRRAVEFYWSTSKKFSDQRDAMEERKQKAPANTYNWKIFHCYLDVDKDKHFEIIQERTKKMLKEGLIDEVKGLLDQGFSPELKPIKSIGYKETINFLQGNILTENDLEERINISTRQLAKSQRTWFSKVDKKLYNPLNDQEKLKEDLADFLNSLE